ncbi:MAG: glycosyltransferase [Ignavibacteriae bacterium]|nr:glycosyltransferase [Ignavibacteriota bacterium]
MIDISVIIPAYNESKKISKDIFAADEFFKSQKFTGEIIIVDDGSSDDTFQSAENCRIQINNYLLVIKLPTNIGKGGAIIEGIKNSKGKIIIYADSGLTVPFENAQMGIDLIKNAKCEIANGSRKMEGSNIIIEQDLNRKVISKIFGIAAKLFLKIPNYLTDTQCGFKVYKGDIARFLYPKLITQGFLFEIELILLAQNENYRILEFPVTWTCDKDSRLSINKSSKKIIKDFIVLYKKFISKKII